MRIFRQTILISILSLSFVWAHANNGSNTCLKKKTGEPTINGYVSDADSKKPVLGVIVSITGKGIDKKETLTTDSSGNFKATQIASGEVTITLEKKGYRTFKKEGVIIKEGTTIKLNLDMEEEEDSEGVSHPLLRMIDGK